MTTIDEGVGQPARQKRAGAQRNERHCSLSYSSRLVSRHQCVTSRLRLASGWGRCIATSRRQQISWLPYNQVEACAQAGPALLANGGSLYVALGQRVNLFVDFLVTKRGLAAVLQASVGFGALYIPFLRVS